jgi:hypothetical protein
MGVISVHASNAIRVAQAREIVIELLVDMPFQVCDVVTSSEVMMQVDGEPHMRSASKLRVTRAQQVWL